MSTASSSPTAGLLRSSTIVGLAVLVSRLLGLIREQMFAFCFGAGRELDAFVTAFRIPNLFRDLFAEGALSSAFVATFSRKLEREGQASAWRLANLVIHALLVIVGGLVVVGMLVSPWVVDLIAPGFAKVPGKTALTVTLTWVLFPFLLLVTLAAVAMGMLNARDRFGVPASASSFFNLGSIVFGLLAAWWMAPTYFTWVFSADRVTTAPPPEMAERAILGMAIGTLVGGALQLLVQLPSLRQIGYRYRPLLSFSDPGLREVMALMAPATIGAAAVQVNVLVNTNFASGLGDGAVSWLNVAFRFMQLPIGLFGVAVGIVALPKVSRSAAVADQQGFASTVVAALRLVLALCLPASVGLAVLAPEIIGLVYEHGRFSPHDTAMAAQALIAYAVGLAGYANIKVLVPAFFALEDARTPALVSIASIATNAGFNWAAINVLGWGHVGLAMVTSVVALLNFVILYVALERRIGGLSGFWDGLARVSVAALAVGLTCLLVKVAIGSWIPVDTLRARAAIVGAGVPLGAMAFVTFGWMLRLPEVRMIVARVGGRLRR